MEASRSYAIPYKDSQLTDGKAGTKKLNLEMGHTLLLLMKWGYFLRYHYEAAAWKGE